MEINTKKLDLPSEPEVKKITSERPDSEESVRVWVVVPDNASEEEVTWPKTKQIEDEINRYFRQEHPNAFPVIFFRKETEFNEELGQLV
jgi:hypothetical protein